VSRLLNLRDKGGADESTVKEWENGDEDKPAYVARGGHESKGRKSAEKWREKKEGKGGTGVEVVLFPWWLMNEKV